MAVLSLLCVLARLFWAFSELMLVVTLRLMVLALQWIRNRRGRRFGFPWECQQERRRLKEGVGGSGMELQRIEGKAPRTDTSGGRSDTAARRTAPPTFVSARARSLLIPASASLQIIEQRG
ncbi:hypothetical protein GCM10009429_36850 [Dyella marensis]